MWLAPPTPPRSLLPDRARVRTSRRPKLGGTSHASHRVTCLACRRWTNGRLWFLRCASHARWTSTRRLCKGIRSTAKRRRKGRMHELQRLARSLALAVHSRRKRRRFLRFGHHPFPPPPSFLPCKVASKRRRKESEVASPGMPCPMRWSRQESELASRRESKEHRTAGIN